MIARQEGQIIAAVRFTLKKEHWLLRGLWVATHLRGKAIGSQLLKASLNGMDSPIWCYPYGYLTKFYSRHGFVEADPAQVPEVILAPWQAYKRKGEDFALMVWSP